MKQFCRLCVVFGFVVFGSFTVAAETYTFGVVPVIGASYLKVAEVKGFWQKQGVSVKVVDYVVPIDCLRGAAQRRFDITQIPMSSFPTLWVEPGLSDSSYLGTFSIADMHKYVLVKPDLLQKSLKNSRIGVFSPAPSNQFLLASYLRTVNTSLSDVELVVMNSMALEANFRQNRLRTILGLEHGNAFYKEADGIVALSTREFYEPHGMTLVRKGGIPQEDLKKIFRGCLEAIQWLRDPSNWEEYKAILNEFCLPGKPDASDEELRALLEQFKFVDSQALLEHNQARLLEYFTEFHKFLNEEQLMTREALDTFTYDNVIQNQALIEVLQEYIE